MYEGIKRGDKIYSKLNFHRILRRSTQLNTSISKKSTKRHFYDCTRMTRIIHESFGFTARLNAHDIFFIGDKQFAKNIFSSLILRIYVPIYLLYI